MAMNKKEQAALEQAQRDLIIAKAFRFTDPAFAPIRMPIPKEGYTHGYDFNSYTGTSYKATSSAGANLTGAHVTKDDNRRMCWSQGPSSLYATRRDALIALRIAKENEFAQALAVIDRQIAEEAP